MEHETLDDAFQDVGPPEASDYSVPPSRENPVYSMGFVPNVQQGQTEEELLCQVALQSDDPVIMTMPSVHGTPINEHAGLQIATWGSGPLIRMACTSPMRFHWFLCKMTQIN